eukprot:34112-Alexandrium_andersonii.AAC.1
MYAFVVCCRAHARISRVRPESLLHDCAAVAELTPPTPTCHVFAKGRLSAPPITRRGVSSGSLWLARGAAW